MAVFQDLTGQRFDRWQVIAKNPSKSNFVRWICQCDCGTVRSSLLTGDLKSGKSRSCGCLTKESTVERSTTHGLSETFTWQSWIAMKRRCLDVDFTGYKDYGARGITICDRWLKFENFLEDMGEKPKGMTLDRIDNNGNYEPGNCRWASRKEQNNNTRRSHLLTYEGKTMTISQWTIEMGLPNGCLQQRIMKLGWTVEKALTEPVRRLNRRANV